MFNKFLYEYQLESITFTLISITMIEIYFKIIRTIISDWILRWKMKKLNFSYISNSLIDISNKLNDRRNVKDLWSELRETFKHKNFKTYFKARVIALENKNSEWKQGSRLIDDIIKFAEEKEILEESDTESLNKFAEEFQLLDRFSIESLEKRKLLLTGCFGAGLGALGHYYSIQYKEKVTWHMYSFF